MSKPDKISEAVGRRGLMLVLSSPSGAGKTSIARRLLDEDDNLTLSVSATTRPPRANEVDGRDYHFVDQERFDRMVAQDEFLEYATVFSNSYGTPKADVMSALERGEDVLFDIDWQGTQQLANAAADLVSVFILPPSREALQQRLVSRAQDSADVVAERMAKASDEISHYREYDYIVVNEDLDRSVESVRAILSAERMRRDRQVGMTGFVRTLQSDVE